MTAANRYCGRAFTICLNIFGWIVEEKTGRFQGLKSIIARTRFSMGWCTHLSQAETTAKVLQQLYNLIIFFSKQKFYERGNRPTRKPWLRPLPLTPSEIAQVVCLVWSSGWVFRETVVVGDWRFGHLSDYHSGSRKVSHQQQSFWRLPSPGRSY